MGLLTVQGVSKEFPGVIALRGVGSAMWGMLRDRGNICAIEVMSAEEMPRVFDISGDEIELAHCFPYQPPDLEATLRELGPAFASAQVGISQKGRPMVRIHMGQPQGGSGRPAMAFEIMTEASPAALRAIQASCFMTRS